MTYNLMSLWSPFVAFHTLPSGRQVSPRLSFAYHLIGLPVGNRQFDPIVDIFITNGIFNRDLLCKLLVW